MTQMLNLDQFAKPKKSVTIRGKEYVIMDMTVELFVEITEAASKIPEDAPINEQLKETLSMIKLYIPTIEDEVLKSLSIEQVSVLARFVRGDLEGMAKEGAEQQAAAQGEEAKKA